MSTDMIIILLIIDDEYDSLASAVSGSFLNDYSPDVY